VTYNYTTMICKPSAHWSETTQQQCGLPITQNKNFQKKDLNCRLPVACLNASRQRWKRNSSLADIDIKIVDKCSISPQRK